MGAHDLNNTLLKLAQDLGLLPTLSHRLGIQALREISKHANVPLQKVRRWNNQRNYRMTHGGIKRPYFVDKEGRDFLSDVFAQDPRPSLEQMQALALALKPQACSAQTAVLEQQLRGCQTWAWHVWACLLPAPAQAPGTGGAFQA